MQAITKRYEEDNYESGAKQRTGTTNRLFEGNWDVLVGNYVYSDASVGRESNKRDVAISIGNTQYKLRPDLRNCLENIAKTSANRGRLNPNNVSHFDRDNVYMELAKNPLDNYAQLDEMVKETAYANGYKLRMFHETNANYKRH